MKSEPKPGTFGVLMAFDASYRPLFEVVFQDDAEGRKVKLRTPYGQPLAVRRAADGDVVFDVDAKAIRLADVAADVQSLGESIGKASAVLGGARVGDGSSKQCSRSLQTEAVLDVARILATTGALVGCPLGVIATAGAAAPSCVGSFTTAFAVLDLQNDSTATCLVP